jgi:hypothetical protein
LQTKIDVIRERTKTMATTPTTTSLEDVILWPCGTWCLREDLEDYLTFKSDDFEVIAFGTARWSEIIDTE